MIKSWNSVPLLVAYTFTPSEGLILEAPCRGGGTGLTGAGF
jgi:hypothetical protein